MTATRDDVAEPVRFRSLRTGSAFSFGDHRYTKTAEWCGQEAVTNATRSDGERVAFLPYTKVTRELQA
jgi:hypothetical protein